MVKIVVECDPLPAQRPRFSGRRCYQSARDKNYREQVQWQARLAMKSSAPLTCALKADVKLYRRYRPTSKRFGDVDNFLKALFDGMNQIVFADDSQIVQCTVTKHTDKDRPRAEILISSAEVLFGNEKVHARGERNVGVSAMFENQ